MVARARDWQVENLACPGSTSAYAISFSGADWQCGSYRAQNPLHVQYVTSQLEVARAFVAASAPYGGDNCAAGLLIQLTPTTCDLHPSAAGQTLLAQTVERVVGRIVPGASGL